MRVSDETGTGRRRSRHRQFEDVIGRNAEIMSKIGSDLTLAFREAQEEAAQKSSVWAERSELGRSVPKK